MLFENPFMKRAKKEVKKLSKKETQKEVKGLASEEIENIVKKRDEIIEKVLSGKKIEDENLINFLKGKLPTLFISTESKEDFENKARNYIEQITKFKENDNYKDLPYEILHKAIEAGKPERYLKIYKKVYEQIKQESPETPDWFINLMNEAISESLNKNLEDEQIITLLVQRLKEVLHKPMNNIAYETTVYFFGEGVPSQEGTPSEEGEVLEEIIPSPEPGRIPETDIWTRLSREVPRNEVIRQLAEASLKIGELIRRLYAVEYSPRIMRRIIFTQDEAEARDLLDRLRQGEYNIPSTVWRRSGLAELFHRLGIKVETTNPFEQLALLCEKGRDIQKALDELMGKIREIENLAENMSEEELKELLGEKLKVIPDELRSLENAISSLEAYFGKGKVIGKAFSKSMLEGIGSSLVLWALAIGFFVPMWMIAQTDKIVKEQFKI